jgi:hypothetical protein
MNEASKAEARAPPCRPFNFAFPPRKQKKHGTAAEAGFSITTWSNRTATYKATTRAERATSAQSLEIGSDLVV